MKIVGRKRRVPVEVERQIKQWKPLKDLAQEMGLSEKAARFIRRHHFKQAAPQS